MTATTAPRRALVVIDVQNEYFEGGGLPIEYPPVQDTLPNVTAAMDAARAAGTPVVVVRHHAPKGAPVFQADNHNGQLHPEVAKRPHDHLVTKSLPSVFAGTDFADWIARNGIDTLSVAGYMTQNCDASTVYEALHRGLAVEFLSDASGALPYENAAGKASAEEIHRVFSVVFHSNFAAVTTTAAWISALREGQPLAKDNVVMSNRRARGL
ncbi:MULTISPECIES: isochorismatase family protein [Variovorax]|jgi:nicotinamidase-related amidase|uniref:isochorismatase family protein n=1 Tax=Variovorax TaxID=34072 RepID=UPI00086B7464|nr:MULTISPECIES: isochorismatase family protein [Variovorax]MBN8755460.1 isochorismatase family protein [Variovorax sp.]ODU14094.1 MAG: isochorismatase [Variovorax sp. SCN 67-85]ODV22844.1 MAG: isochorismatase [Variovorax sp. SCN 67-20]OJZ12570.1 MAG: cysteine hydrolase [Variovorax sp. 67-131]UKI09310.1 isochorismatase family protein [Variovorax paradoxus]